MTVAIISNIEATEPTLALIELQGTIEISSKSCSEEENNDNNILISFKDSPQIKIGHQLLQGTRVPLKYPLVLIKVPQQVI